MFIVKKEIKGKNYYYLRKSIRENKKVKAKTLAYLGKTKKEAEKKAKEFLNKNYNDPKDYKLKKNKGGFKKNEHL